jgi:hypothetical protein
MYGNTPFSGAATTTPAGKRAPEDIITLTAAEKREFRKDLQKVRVAVDRYLPGIYGVSTQLVETPQGVQGLIAIQPPVGHSLGASIIPPKAEDELEPLEHPQELAKDVVATAVATTMDVASGDTPKYAR